MAGEEDVELRDLVTQSLEAKGVLGKIRAQLRANVFLALEEQESQESPHPFVSNKLIDFKKTREGKLSLALVREFLEFFQLEFTTAVFDPETNAQESYPGREQLSRDLGFEQDVPPDTPLLSSLLKRPTHSTTTPSTFNPYLSISTHHTTIPAVHPLSHSPPHHTHSSPHPGYIGPFTTFPTSTPPPHHSHHSPPHTPPSSERNVSHAAAVTNAKPAPSLLTAESTLPINVSNYNSNSNLSHFEPAIPLTTTAHNVNVSSSTSSSLRPDRDRELAKTEKRDLSSDKPHTSTQAPVVLAPANMVERREVSLDNEEKGVGTQRLEIPKTTARNELGDFFSIHTLHPELPPLHVPPLSFAVEQKLKEMKVGETKSDSSVSEHLDEEDSIGSGKTTDVTQTESSLRGDYDFQVAILPQDQ